MNYKCPSCGSQDDPHLLIKFPLKVVQCSCCSGIGLEDQFIQGKEVNFASIIKFK